MTEEAPTPAHGTAPPRLGFWERLLGFFVSARLVPFVIAGLVVAFGVYVAPFDWALEGVPRAPIPVDAIPDVGENQQIVFTEWAGRSPRDVEDQITYPLTTALLGMPGVRTVRSSSMFGFSMVFVIFEDDVEFYWSRARVLEKLASLPPGTLPEGVAPTLGPDATALGQIYWYTLEGHDPEGRVVGGWDLDELRAIQDWTVRFALQGVPGVAEVASIGGFVREYQVDVDPEAMRAHGVTLTEIAAAVRESNLDTGARTIEINGVEYVVRSRGFVRTLEDLELAVVTSREGTPIRVRDVATVTMGPALRAGALDDEGAPAVGGVVVARHRADPLATIRAVEERIRQLAPGLPRRVLDDGTVSQVTIVPFYDRTELIHETIDTLSTALGQQMLIAIVVVLVMLGSLRSSLLIASVMPIGVLAAFGAMKLLGVDANVMALGGIAIAIGNMVDAAIVLVENVSRHLDASASERNRAAVVRRAAAEVAPAVLTSVLSTIIAFLPVFALTSTELKMFAPLALTNVFAMLGALLVALFVVPAAAASVLRGGAERLGIARVLGLPPPAAARVMQVLNWAVAVAVAVALGLAWLPLGRGASAFANVIFVFALLALVLGSFRLLERVYPHVLRRVLAHKAAFLAIPLAVVVFGLTAWLGFDRTFGWLPASMRASVPLSAMARALPGFGREFLPPFDEGAFLYMPTTMPHASIGEVEAMLSEMDARIKAVPEVDRVVGKLGRATSAIDPAPISMIETLVTYVPEYEERADGTRVRRWRDHIRSPHDIWDEVVRAAETPGMTGAPLLMPIQARLVMLQSGMRAPMGMKIHGPDLESVERFGVALEAVLREVPGVRRETVFAERVVGKPYLEIAVDREAIARYGLSVVAVQEAIQLAVGGAELTRTVEGRERFPVRVRYMRERRGDVESLQDLLVPTPGGTHVPLGQLAEIRFVHGPEMIRAEDTFLTSYLIFDKASDVDATTVVARAEEAIQAKIRAGELEVPPGVSYAFAGSFENQLRSEARLKVVVPLAMAVVFVLLYLQFRRVTKALAIFTEILVAVSGAFVILWLYAQPWFLDFHLGATSVRELFRVDVVNLSVAVWVGVVVLIGLATDDGVVMSTFLAQRFEAEPPTTRDEVRERTLEAATRRVRPCLMTTATTVIALLPVITSSGRGADLMRPLALPVIGGMSISLITLFVVPVLHAALEEWRLRKPRSGA